MSTVVAEETIDRPLRVGSASRPGRPGPARPVLAAILAAAVAALAFLWMAGEAHYRSCVAAAEGRYPAVAVSALTGRTTGPLKLSYDRERRAAVEGCGRLPI